MEQIGRYKIIGELGRGAMGVVFRAQDPAIGRMIAIKSIRIGELTEESERERLRERLLREAQSAGVLSHPNIVTIYDVAEEGDMAYIFMELVNGPPLEKMLHEEKTPDKETLLSLLRQTAAALDYAHKKGVIHRDVKPSNIMVHEDGTAKVTDFGVAKIVSQQLTRAGTMMGTPNYMSPEQIQGDAVSGRSDQFSLGVIAYQILTGEKPFHAEYLPTLLFKIVGEEPIAPHRLNPTLSPDVEPVIRKALAKAAEDRYETCTDFITALAVACSASLWVPLPKGASSKIPTGGTDSGSPVGFPELSGATWQTPVPLPSAAAPPSPSSHLDETLVDTNPLPSAPERPSNQSAAPPLSDSATRVAETTAPLPEQSPEPSFVPVVPLRPPRMRPDEMPQAHGLRNAFIGLLAALILSSTVWYFMRGNLRLPNSQSAAQTGTPDSLSQTAPAAGANPATAPPLPDAATPAPPPSPSSSPSSNADAANGGATQTASSSATAPAVGQTQTQSQPAPPAAATMAFQITTNPPGAEATIDASPDQRCTSPCALNLSPGRHTILLRRDGYRDVQRVFNLPDDPGLIVDLVARTGILSLVSTPPGLNIFIDGQAQPRKTPTSLSLPVGSHRVQIVKGSDKQEFAVDIRDGVFTERSVDWGSEHPPGAN